MKYFTIDRIKRCIEHLQNFHSKWVIVPLVFAVNGVNEVEEVDTNALGKAGGQRFLDEYFNGSVIGLSVFPNGNNTLRPRFSDTYGTMKSDGREMDYVSHQKVNLWGSHYSSRGYREMAFAGLLENDQSKFKLNPSFWAKWAAELPSSFHFEELLVWLYAFRGIEDSMQSWIELFVDFQERHLGKGGRFPRGYEVRFNVDNGVPFPLEFLTERPHDLEYQHELMPSKFSGAALSPISATPDDPPLDDNDPILLQVRELLRDNYAGVIFVGPPGTSKTWYAAKIAAKLVDSDPKRVRFVQFHASYQYEDFVEGYVPNQESDTFTLIPKHLLKIIETAEDADGKLCVLVIDELSRSDPGRIFGDALTYIEMTKRGQVFYLSSGGELSIPPNLIFLATMNPLDRGVDEVDAALERRFAKIAMDPNPDKLAQFLTDNGMDLALRRRVLNFFRSLLRNKNRYSRVGHTYFYSVKDENGLRRLWDHQLRFHFEKAFRLNEEEFLDIEKSWERIFSRDEREVVGAPSDLDSGNGDIGRSGLSAAEEDSRVDIAQS